MLVIMVGDITKFIQANDTDLHHQLNGRYKNKEMTLTLNILEVDKNKVPSPSREHMIGMLLAACKETDADFTTVAKKLFVSNAFDRSEDFIVSAKLFSLLAMTCWSTEDSY